MNALSRGLAAPAADIASDPLRNAMRSLAGAASVITAGAGEDRSGFTATSVSSLALDPPSLIVSANRTSSTSPIIDRYRHFGVSVLGTRHRDLADAFAGRGGIKGADRYRGAEWLSLATGAPILADALVAFDCELEETIDRHSHSILIGTVRAIHAGAGIGDALIYWRGGYSGLAQRQDG